MEKTKHSCLLFHTIILASILVVSKGVNVSGNGKYCSQNKSASSSSSSSYNKLFVFGDSYADTGNIGNLGRELTHAWYDPYGISSPGKPTGRFSDGRVLSDFVASFMGIKSPVPYKTRKAGPRVTQHGMNFAVGGSGVFDTGNFQRNLSAQIDLFKKQINLGLYTPRDLVNAVGLVVISGNDYSYIASKDNDTSAALAYIPLVVKQMKADIQRVLSIGITKLIVTNLHPLGCTPYMTRNINYKDCDALVNMGASLHNTQLTNALSQFNSTKPSILLLNVNDPFYNIISQEKGAKLFASPRRPCCEGFTKDNHCGEIDDKGNKKYNLCSNRQDYFYWDDVHPTQAGWTAVAESIKPTIYQFLFK